MQECIYHVLYSRIFLSIVSSKLCNVVIRHHREVVMEVVASYATRGNIYNSLTASQVTESLQKVLLCAAIC